MLGWLKKRHHGSAQLDMALRCITDHCYILIQLIWVYEMLKREKFNK